MYASTGCSARFRVFSLKTVFLALVQLESDRLLHLNLCHLLALQGGFLKMSYFGEVVKKSDYRTFLGQNM